MDKTVTLDKKLGLLGVCLGILCFGMGTYLTHQDDPLRFFYLTMMSSIMLGGLGWCVGTVLENPKNKRAKSSKHKGLSAEEHALLHSGMDMSPNPLGLSDKMGEESFLGDVYSAENNMLNPLGAPEASSETDVETNTPTRLANTPPALTGAPAEAVLTASPAAPEAATALAEENFLKDVT